MNTGKFDEEVKLMGEKIDTRSDLIENLAALTQAGQDLLQFLKEGEVVAQKITSAEDGLYENFRHPRGMVWPRKKESILKERQALFLADHIDEYEGTKEERKNACLAAFAQTQESAQLTSEIETAERKVALLKDDMARIVQRRAGIEKYIWLLRTKAQGLKVLLKQEMAVNRG
jgi:hypothetical protein